MAYNFLTLIDRYLKGLAGYVPCAEKAGMCRVKTKKFGGAGAEKGWGKWKDKLTCEL